MSIKYGTNPQKYISALSSVFHLYSILHMLYHACEAFYDRIVTNIFENKLRCGQNLKQGYFKLPLMQTQKYT